MRDTYSNREVKKWRKRLLLYYHTSGGPFTSPCPMLLFDLCAVTIGAHMSLHAVRLTGEGMSRLYLSTGSFFPNASGRFTTCAEDGDRVRN